MKLKRPPKHPNTPGVPRVPTQQGHFHTEKWDKSHPGRWEEGAGCSADGISTFRCWLYSSIPQNFKSNSASVAVLCTVNTVYLPTAQPRVTDDNSYSLTPGATPPSPSRHLWAATIRIMSVNISHGVWRSFQQPGQMFLELYQWKS